LNAFVTQPVFRFAPSPNGRLHLGHAYSALLNADFARRFGGRFLLRIEDIDTTRCRPELEAAIYEDLAWLGLAWERPTRRQSEHFGDYRAAFLRLKGRGLVYPCFCSRKEIEAAVVEQKADGRPVAHDPDGAPLYPGTCRSLTPEKVAARIAAGEPHAWRLDMAAALKEWDGQPYDRFDHEGRTERVEADPRRWGDAVVIRKEIPASYHVAVVVDDALQGVTHVVRGADLEAATDLHVLLQALLGLPTPLYHHHGLIFDRAGDKLSKSLRSEALGDLRAKGTTAAMVRDKLGFVDQPTPST
jgi:glutamyl-Q tRNA(Asp) synthetase